MGLERLRRRAPSTEVVMMTGYGTITAAVQAMKLGAYDYLESRSIPTQPPW
jgi:ActR/RegA family two-component response regulator